MKLMKKLTPVALATSMALGGLAVPTIASAELSANLGIANMYLWRGVNLTPDAPQVHGGLQYDHGSGAYAGMWTTNEDDGHETDLYFGYGGEVAGFSYDISFWEYLYPEDGNVGEECSLATPPDCAPFDLDENDISELIVALGYGPATLTVYNNQGDDTKYITLGAEFGDYSVTYGVWDTDPTANDYSHLTFGYAATENLSIMVSVADNDIPDTADGAVEEDPLFVVSYNIPLDMK